LLINKLSCRTIYEKENKVKRKEHYDFKLKKFQYLTFWVLFLISIIGGFAGILSIILILSGKCH